MKHIFKKLHIGHNHDPNRSNDPPTPAAGAPAPPPAAAAAQQSPTCHPAPSDQRPPAGNAPPSPSASPGRSPVKAAAAAGAGDRSGDYIASEQEFQMQLALAISVSNSEFRGEDPEGDQIRAATWLSLGGDRRGDAARKQDEVSAEAQSRQYWVSLVV